MLFETYDNQDLNAFLLFKLFQSEINPNVSIFSYICHAFSTYPHKINYKSYHNDVTNFESNIKTAYFQHKQGQNIEFDYSSYMVNNSRQNISNISFRIMEKYFDFQDLEANTPKEPLGIRPSVEYKYLIDFEARLLRKISFYNPYQTPCKSFLEFNQVWDKYIKTGFIE